MQKHNQKDSGTIASGNKTTGQALEGQQFVSSRPDRSRSSRVEDPDLNFIGIDLSPSKNIQRKKERGAVTAISLEIKDHSAFSRAVSPKRAPELQSSVNASLARSERQHSAGSSGSGCQGSQEPSIDVEDKRRAIELKRLCQYSNQQNNFDEKKELNHWGQQSQIESASDVTVMGQHESQPQKEFEKTDKTAAMDSTLIQPGILHKANSCAPQQRFPLLQKENGSQSPFAADKSQNRSRAQNQRSKYQKSETMIADRMDFPKTSPSPLQSRLQSNEDFSRQAGQRISDLRSAVVPKTYVHGRYVVQSQIHRNFTTPWVRQETQHLENLTFGQKVSIVIVNMVELIFISSIVCVSSTNQSYTNIPYLGIALVYIRMLARGQPNTSKKNPENYRKSLKRLLSLLGVALCSIAAAVKISLLISEKVKTEFDPAAFPDLYLIYGQFGFRYDGGRDSQPYKINWIKTLLPELLNVVSFGLYACLIQLLYHTASSVHIIQRTLTRHIPVQKRPFGCTASALGRTSALRSKRRPSGIQGQKTLASTIKMTKEKITESMLGHPYYNDQIQSVFYVLVFLLVLDISACQTAIHLLFSIFTIILQTFWVQHAGAFTKQVRSISCFIIVLATQIILALQMLLICIFNIEAIKQRFDWEKHSAGLKVLQAFGILAGEVGAPHEFATTLTWHLVLASLIITLSSYYHGLYGATASAESTIAEIQPHWHENQTRLPIANDVIASTLPEQNLQADVNDGMPLSRFVSQTRPQNNQIQVPLLSQLNSNGKNANRFNFAESNLDAQGQNQAKYHQSSRGSDCIPSLDKADERSSRRASYESAQVGRKAFRLGVADLQHLEKKHENVKPQNFSQESAESSSFSRALLAYFLLWMCRATSLVYIFLYHDWQSVFVFIWISHSLLLDRILSFRTITSRFYLPVMIVIYFWYCTVNINGLSASWFEQIEENSFGANPSEESVDFLRGGLIKFKLPFLEVLFMQVNHFCFFAWIKSCEGLNSTSDDFGLQGAYIMKNLSGESSNAFQNLVLLTFPYCETLLLIAILVSGLNKVDLYHVLYLVVFVAFIVWPQKRRTMTPVIVAYAALFLLLKYIWSMYAHTGFAESNTGLFQILGIASDLGDEGDPRKVYRQFGYPFWPQQWAVLFSSYLELRLIGLFEDQDQLSICSSVALKKLQEAFPNIRKISSKIYILKRAISLAFVIFLFLALAITDRSFASWGYQATVNLILYAEVASGQRENKNSEKKYWQAIVIYSSCLILTNATTLFLQFVYAELQPKPPKEQPVGSFLSFLEEIKALLPDWIFVDDNLERVIGLTKYQESGSKGATLFWAFAPSLIYLCCSIYVLRVQQKWSADDQQLEQDIRNHILIREETEGESLNVRAEETNLHPSRKISKLQQTPRDENSVYDESITSYRSLIDAPAPRYASLQDEYDHLQSLHQRIRFSGMYFSYKVKFYWPIIDLIAQYSHMVLYSAVLALNLFWWFNLINILQMATLVVFNITLGQQILKRRTDWLKSSSEHSKATEAPFQGREAVFASKTSSLRCIQVKDGEPAEEAIDAKCLRISDLEILQQKHEFKNEIKDLIMQMRFRAWNAHYAIITVALVLIFPSEHLLFFRQTAADIAAKCRGDPQREATYESQKKIAQILTNTIYYMFLAGVQYSPEVCKDSRSCGSKENPNSRHSNSYLKQIYGYLLILVLCLMERLLLQWLQNRFYCTDQIFLKIKTLEKRLSSIEAHQLLSTKPTGSNQAKPEGGSKVSEITQALTKQSRAELQQRVSAHAKQVSTNQTIIWAQAGISAVPEIEDEDQSVLDAQTQQDSPVDHFHELTKHEEAFPSGGSKVNSVADTKQEKKYTANKELPSDEEKSRSTQSALRNEILRRILVDTDLQLQKGFKTILEDLVAFSVLTSAVTKLNLQSFFEFGLVVLFYCRRSPKTILFIMNTVSLVWFARLVVTFSNMFDFVNPMDYPAEIASCLSKSADPEMCGIEQAIPWIGNFDGWDEDKLPEVAWAVWGLLIIFKEKLYVLLFDFVTILTVYVYYQTSQYWLLHEDFEVLMSKETEELIVAYRKRKLEQDQKKTENVKTAKSYKVDSTDCIPLISKGNHEISLKVLSKIDANNGDSKEENEFSKAYSGARQSAYKRMNYDASVDSFSKSPVEAADECLEQPLSLSKRKAQTLSAQKQAQDEIKETIYELLSHSKRYSFYMFSERFALLYYPKVMVFLIMSLAIMSNTVFALGYILLLSVMMFSSKLFLHFDRARSQLQPILQRLIIPYILLEILAQITYQLPCFTIYPAGISGQLQSLPNQLPSTNLEDLGDWRETARVLADFIGLTQYYSIRIDTVDGINAPTFTLQASASRFQLWLKALLYFFVSVNIQVIESSCFSKLEQFLSLSKMKGQAVTYLFNNLKIKQYVKYQESNLKREQMMIGVKEKCDRWRAVFENQARQEGAKLGLAHDTDRESCDQMEPHSPSDQHLSSNQRKNEETKKPASNSFGIKLKSSPEVYESILEASDDSKESKIGEVWHQQELIIGGIQSQGKAFGIKNTVENGKTSENNQAKTQKGSLKSRSAQLKQDEALYAGISFEFLVIKMLAEMRKLQSLKALEEQKAALKQNPTLIEKEMVCFDTINQDLKQNGSKSIYQARYTKKLNELNWFVRLYLKLRKNIVSPVLLLNNKLRVQEMLETIKKGETITRSSIEDAVIIDMQHEINSGLPTTETVSHRTTTAKMMKKMCVLFISIMRTNLDIVTYLLMIAQFAIVCPGLATVIYPLSIFGFAILYETGPPKSYWHFIMAYTQILIFIEFSLSLVCGPAQSVASSSPGSKSRSWPWLDAIIGALVAHQGIAGISLVGDIGHCTGEKVSLAGESSRNDAGELLRHFAPKIAIMCSVMLLIQNHTALDILEQREPQKERIEAAYVRYVKGQYNVDIRAIKESNPAESTLKDFSKEFEEWIACYAQSKANDDFEIRYGQDDEAELGALDMWEIDSAVEKRIKWRSELSYSGKRLEESGSENLCVGQKHQSSNTNIQRINESRKQAYNWLKNVAVNNSFLQMLFPTIKIQKPGQDFYQDAVIVQVLMIPYILVFYTRMTASGASIVEQTANKQFSADMLFVLLGWIAVMIMDRAIYKSKSFRELGDSQQTTNEVNVAKLQQQISAFDVREVSPEAHTNKWKSFGLDNEQQSRKGQLRFSGTPFASMKSEQLSQGDPSLRAWEGRSTSLKEKAVRNNRTLFMNLDQVLARTSIDFKSVMKFYFQWFVLLAAHWLLFFWLPVTGGANTSKDFPGRQAIQGCYILCCLYFYLSAMQIKRGLPEEMKTHFMMGSYRSLNRTVFNVFMNIPFLFELRVFIDWICTKTALDVYQWTKLAQCQVDLYKAKSLGDYYYARPLGQRVPRSQKGYIGCSLVLAIVVLVMGPMFLFSTLSTRLGSVNPVSKVEVRVSLEIVTHSDMFSFGLLAATSVYKKLDHLAEPQFETMGFTASPSTSLFDATMAQYIIMNQAQELWLIADAQRVQAAGYLEKLKNITEGNPANASDPDEPTKATFVLSYDLQRAQPASAQNLQSEQRFPIYPLKPGNSSIPDDLTYDFTGLVKAFTSCPNFTDPRLRGSGSAVLISLGAMNKSDGNRTVQAYASVLQLGLSTNVASASDNPGWQKRLALSYTPCAAYPLWVLEQTLDSEAPEVKAFPSNPTAIAKQLSFFILSAKTNPLSSGYSVLTLYITFVYAFAKLFRSGFVPATAQIQITDARDPKDLLMLCETIYLYRMKEKLKEEEELYCLLIDIMRSPVIFKAICGDSVKTQKLSPVQQQTATDLQTNHQHKGDDIQMYEGNRLEGKQRRSVKKSVVKRKPSRADNSFDASRRSRDAKNMQSIAQINSSRFQQQDQTEEDYYQENSANTQKEISDQIGRRNKKYISGTSLIDGDEEERKHADNEASYRLSRRINEKEKFD